MDKSQRKVYYNEHGFLEVPGIQMLFSILNCRNCYIRSSNCREIMAGRGLLYPGTRKLRIRIMQQAKIDHERRKCVSRIKEARIQDTVGGGN